MNRKKLSNHIESLKARAAQYTLVQDICHEYIAKASQSTVGNRELSFCQQILYSLLTLLLSDSTGSVLCSVENPVPVTTRVEARIIVFNIDIPITVGFPVSAVKSVTTKSQWCVLYV